MKKTLCAAVALAALLGLAGAANAAPARQPLAMGTPQNTFRADLLKEEEARGRIPSVRTPIAADGLVGPLGRATVFSRDRSRALFLYQDVLGFKSNTNTYWSGLAINRVKGTTGLHQHAIIMSAGSSAEGNIGVYQLYREKFAPPPIDDSATVKTGDYGLTFYTNDIAKVFAGAQKIGFTIIQPPTVEASGDTRLIFRGPDGLIEHFVQAK